ncbi:MAG: hypothetical protein PGN29_10795 [Gordonia paraffinivorans]
MGTAVVLLVVAGRLLVPLLIPRFPVPAIIGALVLDAVDQTVFQQVPGLDISGYQSYDKALDVYYLAIAYLATLQNWSDPLAFGIARFLFYYRLIGVVAFEYSSQRWLLLAFPNIFEYFFIAYELVRCRWAPTRLGHRTLLLLAAGIWVLIKLPQEWWLHVAELDVTDEVKTTVLGAGLDDSWTVAIANRPWVLPIAAVVIAVLAIGIRIGARRLPAGDWPFGFDVSARTRGGRVARVPAGVRATQSAFVRGPLVEKIVLVSMLLLVFSRILPGVDATSPQIVVTVAILVVANSVISHHVAGRGVEWTSTVSQFIAVAAINAGGRRGPRPAADSARPRRAAGPVAVLPAAHLAGRDALRPLSHAADPASGQGVPDMGDPTAAPRTPPGVSRRPTDPPPGCSSRARVDGAWTEVARTNCAPGGRNSSGATVARPPGPQRPEMDGNGDPRGESAGGDRRSLRRHVTLPRARAPSRQPAAARGRTRRPRRPCRPRGRCRRRSTSATIPRPRTRRG